MSKEQLIRDSISRWESNARAASLMDVNVGWQGCALCRAYYADGHCRVCPVRAKTGEQLCHGTPYYDARAALTALDLPNVREHSARMVEFLKGLLPESGNA